MTTKLHTFLRLWDVWANTLNFDGVCSSIFIFSCTLSASHNMTFLTIQANLSTSRGWDFLRGWMSVRVRGIKSPKGVDEEEEEEEEEGDKAEIDVVGKEEEKLGAEEQLKRRCDVITIKGGFGFLQKVSTDV